MALSQTEAESLSSRFLTIENKLNEVQVAINNLATKSQSKALLNIRQAEIIQIQEDLAALAALLTSDAGTSLTAHKVDTDAHSSLLSLKADYDHHHDSLYPRDAEVSLFLTPSSDGVDGYDADPNAGAAPSVLQNASTGTWYWELTNMIWWRKTETYWEVTEKPQVDQEIYVDVAGDDTAAGTEAAPIQTIREATRRVNPEANCTVYFGAGTFEQFDAEGASASQTIFSSNRQAAFEGTVSVLDTFEVDTVVDNVITAVGSPGWTPDEFKGQYYEWPIIPTFNVRRIILSNDANSLTVAATSWGLPAPGTDLSITENGTVFITPATNPQATNNIFWMSGNVSFRNIDFDATVNTGFSGPDSNPNTNSYFDSCRFFGWGYAVAVRDSGRMTITGCFFEGGSGKTVAAYFSGGGYVGNDCVFKDYIVGIRAWGQADLYFGPSTMWLIGCTIGVQVDHGADYRDECTAVYVAAGVNVPNRCVDVSSFSSFKGKNPFNEHPGSTAQYAYVYKTNLSPAHFHVKDNAGQVGSLRGATADILLDGDPLSLADLEADPENTAVGTKGSVLVWST